MSHPFESPQGKEILKRVAQTFRSEELFISLDSNIIFVCGGPMEDPYMRPKFLEYAKEELPKLRVFLAETAQQDLVSSGVPEFYNVAKFEELMADISICIIIFPESAGSYTELGYFAQSETIRKKLLVVNDANLQGQDSFISIGAINTIDKFSAFQSTIQIDHKNPNFNLVKGRLEERIWKRNVSEKRIRFNYKPHAELSNIEKFYFIFEIIRLFQVISLEGIVYAYKSVFGNVKTEETKQLLSILFASNYVTRYDEDPGLFAVNRQMKSFIEFEKLDVDALRLEILDLYENNLPEIAELVRNLGQ